MKTTEDILNEIMVWLQNNAVNADGYVCPFVMIPFTYNNVKYTTISFRPTTKSLNDFANSIYNQIVVNANRDISEIKIDN